MVQFTVPSAKLAAARAALIDALAASDDREVRRLIDESLQHLHALEAELAADRKRERDRRVSPDDE